MRRIILCILGLALCQSFVYAGAIEDYEAAGFDVPDVSIVYVDGFENPNTQSIYMGGVVLVKRGPGAERAIRHEIAHAVTMDAIEANPELFEAYRLQRIGKYRPVNAWHNLTADDLDIHLQWYRWYWYTLDVRELVAEDICFIVYGLPTMQVDTIGLPDAKQQKQLKNLLGGD